MLSPSLSLSYTHATARAHTHTLTSRIKMVWFNSCTLLITEKAKVNALIDGNKDASKEGGSGHIAAHTFTFRELAAATRNFRPDCLIGEGGFGRVYKGRLESTNQVS